MSNCRFCQSVRNWANRPFNENQNATNWFLFVGFLVFVSWLWTRILTRILPA